VILEAGRDLTRTGDDLIPVTCADETAKALARAFAAAGAPERFQYRRVEGTSHGTGPEESREMLAWFQEWLQER
jgi:hypothetical protein